jgi:hypothetical protein
VITPVLGSLSLKWTPMIRSGAFPFSTQSITEGRGSKTFGPGPPLPMQCRMPGTMKSSELLCAEKTILLPYDVPVATHRLQRADAWIAPAVIQDQLPTATHERGQVGIGCRRPVTIENGSGFRQVRAVDIKTERVVVRIAEYKKLQELVLQGKKKGRECRVENTPNWFRASTELGNRLIAVPISLSD